MGKEESIIKSLEEIINQEPVFINEWTHKIDVIGDFECIYMTKAEYEATESPHPNESYWLKNKDKMRRAIEKYREVNILFASYGQDNYTGDAWVLFEKEGKLFEVNGSHCSCYGLEDQWFPEEVILEELENRLLNGTFGEDKWSGNTFKEELCKFLGVEFVENM
ncbi:hypothetical protein [Bacillus chungangensis]|uniref:SMI1/KNR4 family protein n=1 Tax=Bacillus chungangensis TaxID=587633 RepID=A0ABT9WM96_9BACI|nr:hypothetical protein [Bacillus chungangensis]MDQ0174418.1 hypothetical protein [Bacillus chungangensis]